MTIILACVLQFPHGWPVGSLIDLQALCFAIGRILMLQSRRTDVAILLMVRILSGEQDHILDAGCGAGRTSLAIAKVMGRGRIIAFDRFDANYIDGGGRTSSGAI